MLFEEIEAEYFTRDDINELMSEINDVLEKGDDLHGCTVIGIYLEKKNNLELDIADNYGYEKTISQKIDLRKANTPCKLVEKYCPMLVEMIVDTYQKDNDFER